MAGFYEKIPNPRVALKLKVLKAIREEVGDDRPIQVEHHHKGSSVSISRPVPLPTKSGWNRTGRWPVL